MSDLLLLYPHVAIDERVDRRNQQSQGLHSEAQEAEAELERAMRELRQSRQRGGARIGDTL